MFNLCHWLKVTGGGDPAPVLKQAGKRLFAVTINGADKPSDGATGWGRLIQPLDRGTFDLAGLLKTLKDTGYRGPIGLQCYGLGGDARLHLARSIKAWRALQEKG
jgi:sugar phosphate isomerase/epimerase